MKINACNLIFRSKMIKINTSFTRIESGCFDLPFDLINNLIDLMFGEIEKVTLRWKLNEWMSNIPTVTHQVKQFNVVIAITNPYFISLNAI